MRLLPLIVGMQSVISEQELGESRGLDRGLASVPCRAVLYRYGTSSFRRMRESLVSEVLQDLELFAPRLIIAKNFHQPGSFMPSPIGELFDRLPSEFGHHHWAKVIIIFGLKLPLINTHCLCFDDLFHKRIIGYSLAYSTEVYICSVATAKQRHNYYHCIGSR